MSLLPLTHIESPDRDHVPDLRGWHVVARDGTSLGRVAEVIVETEFVRPVYIDVVSDSSATHAPLECWIRVPLEHASLDDASELVVLTDFAVLGMGTATLATRGST